MIKPMIRNESYFLKTKTKTKTEAVMSLRAPILTSNYKS